MSDIPMPTAEQMADLRRMAEQGLPFSLVRDRLGFDPDVFTEVLRAHPEIVVEFKRAKAAGIDAATRTTYAAVQAGDAAAANRYLAQADDLRPHGTEVPAPDEKCALDDTQWCAETLARIRAMAAAQTALLDYAGGPGCPAPRRDDSMTG